MRASASFRNLLRRAVALLGCALGVASCTSVLSLDAFKDAPDALCSMLAGCFADGAAKACHDRVVAALDAADADLIASWITAMGAGCLDNCSAARFCLDVQPVCETSLGGPCKRREDCCQFAEGGRDCALGADGGCCLTAGQACSGDAQCCPDAGLCNPITHTCGGTECRGVRTHCDIAEECCSKRCVNHACQANVCDPDEFPCADARACCSAFCRPDGRCGDPVACQLLRGPCTQDADCCAVNGQAGLCFVPAGASVGVCSTGSDCFPDEAECQDGALCCSGTCNPVYHRCSEPCTNQPHCQSDSDCCTGTCDVASGVCGGCSLGGCQSNDDCCSNRCVANTCAPLCVATACDHDVCTTGTPLQLDCTQNWGACAAKVCETDPYCCCNLWDDFCVTAAAAEPSCAGLCP
jgi:hypothetical protein